MGRPRGGVWEMTHHTTARAAMRGRRWVQRDARGDARLARAPRRAMKPASRARAGPV